MTELSTGMPTPLINAAWLVEHLSEVTILCTSMGPNPPTKGIPGAMLVDHEGCISDPTSGLPHTAPENLAALFMTLDALAKSQPSQIDPQDISELIQDKSHEQQLPVDLRPIVIYDADHGVTAPRLWWLAHHCAGIPQVAVLDGGLDAWCAAGGELSELANPLKDVPAIGVAGEYDTLLDAPTVCEALEDPQAIVVDARSRGRFRATEPEPRQGMRGGHMPGAKNLPFSELYDSQGCYKTPDQLREIFHNTLGLSPEEAADKELIFSCGSGITACVDALGATLAGYPNLKIYEGSWSEWGQENAQWPVVEGE